MAHLGLITSSDKACIRTLTQNDAQHKTPLRGTEKCTNQAFFNIFQTNLMYHLKHYKLWMRERVIHSVAALTESSKVCTWSHLNLTPCSKIRKRSAGNKFLMWTRMLVIGKELSNALCRRWHTSVNMFQWSARKSLDSASQESHGQSSFCPNTALLFLFTQLKLAAQYYEAINWTLIFCRSYTNSIFVCRYKNFLVNVFKLADRECPILQV